MVDKLFRVPMSDARAQLFDAELFSEAWALVRKLEISYPELTRDKVAILMSQCLMKVARYKDESN
jgi:hypothetical protein